ncbi:MAG: outer membrane beta-barrel protein [Chlorobiaceae bacterium]
MESVLFFFINQTRPIMKKALLTFATVCLFATPAMANTPYVSFSSGLGIPFNSSISADGVTFNNAITYKTGVPYIAALGSNGDGYRVEATYGYLSSHVDTINGPGSFTSSVSGLSVSMSSYMANSYYDITSGNSNITPYLMAGIGAATLNASYAGISSGTTVFAWQVGAGIDLKASDHVTIDLGYRYFKPSAVTTIVENTNVSLSSAISNILLGIRYSF